MSYEEELRAFTRLLKGRYLSDTPEEATKLLKNNLPFLRDSDTKQLIEAHQAAGVDEPPELQRLMREAGEARD